MLSFLGMELPKITVDKDYKPETKADSRKAADQKPGQR